MCRLAAMISAAPACPSWGLITAPKSLLVQSSARADNPQRDGWGFAAYARSRPVITKSPRPLPDEADRARSVAEGILSHIVLAHVRRASNPLGLPQDQLRGDANTQPFTFRNLVFAHNGTLNIPNEVRDTLGPYRRRVKGVNDSEVLFWVFARYVMAGLTLPRAYMAMLRHLHRVWRGLRRTDGEPYTGLNVIASDGATLFAACHALSRPDPAKPSLCTPSWPFWRMAWRSSEDQAWLASEPLDARRGWQPLGLDEFVTARSRGGRIVVRTGRLDLPTLRRR